MNPVLIALMGVVAMAGLVAVVRLTRHKGTRAAPRAALDATPPGWGSMTLACDREPHTAPVEPIPWGVAHEWPVWEPPAASRWLDPWLAAEVAAEVERQNADAALDIALRAARFTELVAAR